MARVDYAINPGGTVDKKVPCTVSIAGGVLIFSAAQTGNIGVGHHVIAPSINGFMGDMIDSTHSTITDQYGAPLGDVSPETLTSISPAFGSLTDYENIFTGPGYLDNTDLVAAMTIAGAPSYHDEIANTPDSSPTTVNFGNSDATYPLIYYTPKGGTESIYNQRFTNGKWETAGFYHRTRAVTVQESGFRMEGIQIREPGFGTYVAPPDASFEVQISHCYIETTSTNDTFDGCQFDTSAANGVFKVRNTVFIGNAGHALLTKNLDSTANAYLNNCTFSTSGVRAIRCEDDGTFTFKNCLARGASTTDFYKHSVNVDFNLDYCASADATADDWGGTGNRINQSGNLSFVDVGGKDFDLTGSDTGAAGFGDDLSTDINFAVIDDIEGIARPVLANYSIGAFEGEAAGAGVYQHSYTKNLRHLLTR